MQDHEGVSTRFVVRLPDELVVHVDRAVAQGRASSRADVLGRTIEHDRVQHGAEADLRRLREAGALGPEEMLVIARATSEPPIPLA